MPHSSDLNRREFLKYAGLAGGALALPAALYGYTRSDGAQTVRVRGRVVAGGQGLADVSVTDGRSVVRTGPDGTFDLMTTEARPYVYYSVPAGYAIPQNNTGTARFYQPITADGSGTMSVTFELAERDGPDERHAFFLLADPQTQTPDEMQQFHDTTVPDVRGVVQGMSGVASFGVGCGDLMFDDLSLYPEYERAVDRMGMPFFQVVGNHDLNFDAPTDFGSTQTFRSFFGPEYYSFDRGAVHYVVLDDVFWPGSDGFGSNTDDYLGYVDADQLAWLEQDLSYVEQERPVVVFAHIPFLGTMYRRAGEPSPSPRGMVSNRDAVQRLLEPFDARLIVGHVHENAHDVIDGLPQHITGTTCGAWWTGPICYDGTPAGYAVYEVDGTSISRRYKATGKPFEHQMRVYEAGATPEAPNEFVANVWDADDDWTVVWYEDGTRVGRMARRTGYDPLAVELYNGEEQPEKRTWVNAVPTNHLFYAPFNSDADTIRVEATDGNGRSYTATLTPEQATSPVGAE